MQLVPVQKGNPPVVTQVQWDSPETQQLWERTCADCHSNETKWPWYSNLAPASWLEAVHIADGRAQFNISDTSSVPAFIKSMFPNNARMNILNGSMPPADYLIMHPEARLSDAEKQQLIQGLQNSIK
ncbi:MAG: heme-binding domain-containing protein [Anaerolineae bacterium]|nr:heme-binding domain-containing protein [Anaerolineae bacterium]